jgi:hypothetical protein
MLIWKGTGFLVDDGARKNSTRARKNSTDDQIPGITGL